MKDLLREVKELEAAIEHATQVADSYNDTEPDCNCAQEHRQLAHWLTELLEIKNARLSAEVFMNQHPAYLLDPDPELVQSDIEIGGCQTCGWTGGLQEAFGRLKCPNCGRLSE